MRSVKKCLNFTFKVNFLCQTSPLHQFLKFNNFLWVCWFLGKFFSNFVPPTWKLNNLYYLSAGCETYFYIGVSKEVGANVGRITLGILIFSAGMFVSSTALLPSTTSMYLCMLSHGAWFQQNYKLAIFFTALSTFVR